MGTTGVRIFNNMLDAAGSFGSGLVSVLTNCTISRVGITRLQENGTSI